MNSGVNQTLLLNETGLQSYNFNNSTFSLDSDNSPGILLLVLNLQGSFAFDKMVFPSIKSKVSITQASGSIQTFNVLEFNAYAAFATSSATTKVNTLILNTGVSYSLSLNHTLNVIDEIRVLNANCGAIANVASSSTSRARLTLDKEMSISNVSLKNMNVDGAKLTINNGIDEGNNIGNYEINSPEGKDYYWVGGAGNWSDTQHWNVMVEGVLQPIDCTPGALDDVYFNENSFTASGEIVNMDLNRIDIHSMKWSTGNILPVLRFGISQISLYINGSLEFYEGMTVSINGSVNTNRAIYFASTEAGNYYDSKGVNTEAIRLNVSPAYDFEIRNDIRTSTLYLSPSNGAYLSVTGKSLYCSSDIRIYTDGSNSKVDISNSTINANYVSIGPASSSSVITSGTRIISRGSILLNNTSNMNFKRIELTGTASSRNFESNVLYEVSTDSLLVHNDISMTGYVSAGVVNYTKLGTQQIISANSILVIRNELTYDSSPCELFKLSSSITSSGGDHAIVRYVPCNLNLLYAELTNIRFDDTGLACTPDINVLGEVFGDNTFVTETPLIGVDGTFIDTVMYCANMPFEVDLIGVGNPASIQWYYENELLSGMTDPYILVDTIGDFKAVVSYSQSNGLPCAIEPHVILREIIDTVSPEFTVRNATFYVEGCTTAYVNNTTGYDIKDVTESCHMGDIWYKLTGATVIDSVPGTLNGVSFNYGNTLVTAYASDSIPSGWYPSGTTPVPLSNIGMKTFDVIVTDLANTISITCANTNAVSGTAGAPGGTVYVYEDTGSPSLASAIVEGDGTWVASIYEHNLPVGAIVTARLDNEGCFTDSDKSLIQGLNCGFNIPAIVLENTQIAIYSTIMYVNYKWSITSGNTQIVGSDNTQSVDLQVGTGDFILRLESVDAASCYTVCETQVKVIHCPDAILSNPGVNSVCSNENKILQIALTGEAPWIVSYSKTTGGTTVEDVLPVITSEEVIYDEIQEIYLYIWNILPPHADYVNYTLTGVENNYCEGIASGSVAINNIDVSVYITGAEQICAGTSTQLFPVSGGTWTSNNENVATVDQNGKVTGIGTGTATFTFDRTGGCTNTTGPVTVGQYADVERITGVNIVCVAETIQLENTTPGGIWSVSDITKGVLNSSTGSVVTLTGVAEGNLFISYTVGEVPCQKTVTFPVKVISKRSAEVKIGF